MKRAWILLTVGALLAGVLFIAAAEAARSYSRSRNNSNASQAAVAGDYKLLVTRNIFLKDRTPPRSTGPSYVRPQRPRNVEEDMMLRGTALQGGLQEAFIEDARSGRTMRVAAGDAIAYGKIDLVTKDSVTYRVGSTSRTIHMGDTLAGSSYAPPETPSTSTGPVSTAPASTTEPTSAPDASSTTGPAPAGPAPTAAPTPSGADDVLKRLRERRLKETQ